MANTKKFTDRAMRKGVKRSQRKKLKALEATMTTAERKKYRKEDPPVGIREFLTEARKPEDE